MNVERADRLEPLGDGAFVLRLIGPPDGVAAEALAGATRGRMPAGVVDVVPAFDTVTFFYDPGAVPAGISAEAWLCRIIDTAWGKLSAKSVRPLEVAEIPVCYGQAHGPDLAELAAAKGMSLEEVVGLHAGAEYTVLAVGFMPGFAYLGGLPEILQTPRRAMPRRRVEPGSVGIGGMYTGVYPFASPGGWNLIGRTALRLFDAHAARPALLSVGQRVRFVRVDA